LIYQKRFAPRATGHSLGEKNGDMFGVRLNIVPTLVEKEKSRLSFILNEPHTRI